MVYAQEWYCWVTLLGHTVGNGGEGNGTPLQYSCLENPMDGGAWWAAVHGLAKCWTRLKQLSSSTVGNGHVDTVGEGEVGTN